MLLITPQEIIICAFSKREEISVESIRHASIDIAQERYIASRLGYELFDKICNNQFSDFTYEYIKPALSHYVRYLLIDDLLIQIDDRGCINFTGKNSYTTKNDTGETQDITSKSGTGTKNLYTFDSQDRPGTGTDEEESTSQTNGTDNRTITSSGTVVGNFDTYAGAPSQLIHKLQIRALADANTLMNKAIRHIENNEFIFGKFKGSARHYF